MLLLLLSCSTGMWQCMSLEHGFGLNQTSCCTIRQARVSRFQRFQFKLELENELAVVATSKEEVEGLDVLGDSTLSNVCFDLQHRERIVVWAASEQVRAG